MIENNTENSIHAIASGLDAVVAEKIAGALSGDLISLSADEIRAITAARDYLNQLAKSYTRRTGRPRRFASDAERYAYHNERRRGGAK